MSSGQRGTFVYGPFYGKRGRWMETKRRILVTRLRGDSNTKNKKKKKKKQRK